MTLEFTEDLVCLRPAANQDIHADHKRLHAALGKVTIEGTHAALMVGADHPPHTASHKDALAHYGEGDRFDAWCCWKALMETRTLLGMFARTNRRI